MTGGNGMKCRAGLAAVFAALVAAGGAVTVVYEVEIPAGPKSRQQANAMVAAVGPVVTATAALRQSIVSGETSVTVVKARQKAVQAALLKARDATLTSAKVLRKSDELLSQFAWD